MPPIPPFPHQLVSISLTWPPTLHPTLTQQQVSTDVNSYCTVLDKRSQSKFLCYTRRKDGMLSGQRFALKSTEDYVLKLRASCNSGDVSVTVHEVGAELRLGSSPGDLSVTLSRLEGPQATDKLRELLFTMADSLTHGPPSASPVKNYQRRPTEFEPWQEQSSTPAMTMKRRLPGSSLINPGVKKYGVSYRTSIEQ
uniref:Uncharacterized protein n=1 Tax=Neolamprologus brichardi TaxID=32507 RepID=A0A3Q4MQS6_NEOBR